jgi:hypothetical protein
MNIVPFARGYAGTYGPTFAPLAPYRPQEVSPPTPQASVGSLRDWWREMRGEPVPKPPSRTESAVVGLRHNGESAVMGALLAIIDTDLGGLDFAGRVPLDWVGSAAFFALSVKDADKPDGLASDYRALGQACTSVAMYRMIHKWREAAKDAKIPLSAVQGIPQNKLSGDPVLDAGRSAAF